MPNRATPVVSVRSARCSAIMILILGILFDLTASVYFGFNIYFYLSTSYAFQLSSMGAGGKLYWRWGYPLLIGTLIQVTGCVGLCASNPRRLRNKCRTATFCIFSIVLIGFESYIIDAFKLELTVFIRNFKAGACNEIYCYVYLSSYGSFVFLAALILINCIWCVICCLGSLFCMPGEHPRAQDGEQQPTTAQDMMMQETQPSMYNNPALQASTENLQGNAPMAYGSGPPTNPTMQGNMPMQGNAPMACGSGSSLYPKVPGNMQSMQGSATPMAQATSGEKNAK
ncbi:uncharacterized protein LOC116295346 [Actinia tenebrosa]|uniref:Uncharacterized protein LOC116295346 n=1 Tax=Actinia tenebrosa TaxID=6105 RepID=A0A6P8I277_ACTTE|nr:uncharacterized protein LOC116295346 [Actinia tenebrosa]